jgi:bifunctional DNA-binding transcriptional regulator/antitoxin component of YhaV-PrlF toxin-antitoxin module
VLVCLYMSEKETRKIVKNGRDSYYINIPKDLMRELGWRERQKLTIRRVSNRLVVEDWKK